MASLGAASIRAACEYPSGTASVKQVLGVGGEEVAWSDSGSPAASEDRGVIVGVGYLAIPVMP